MVNKFCKMYSLGERIKKARRAKNLTQSQIAGKLGVTHQTVGYWENGKVTPKDETLRALAAELGLPISQLRGEADSTESNQALEDMARENAALKAEVSTLRQLVEAKNELIEVLKSRQ